MKYFTAAAAALFLIAAPCTSYAQQNNDGGSGGVTNDGGNEGSSNNNGSDATGSTSRSEQSCTKVGPGATFESMNGKCRDEINIWIQKQNGQGIEYQGDVAVGSKLPGSVEFTEVPAYRHYGYARINGKNVLIDRDTRRIVHVE